MILLLSCNNKVQKPRKTSKAGSQHCKSFLETCSSKAWKS